MRSAEGPGTPVQFVYVIAWKECISETKKLLTKQLYIEVC